MRAGRIFSILLIFLIAAFSPALAVTENTLSTPVTLTPAASAAPTGVTNTGMAPKSGENPPILPMKAHFAAKSVAAGDPAVLNLDFTLPENAKLVEPIKIEGLPEGETVSVKITATGLSLTLLADTLDTFKVGPLTLDFTGKDGKRRTLRSEPAAITVTTALASDPSKQSPMPMKDILPVGFAYKREAIIAAAVLAVLVFAYFLWRFLRRRRKKLEIIHAIPPHIAALSALDRLEGNSSISDKGFAFELSSILRTYMGSIRSYPAAEMTYEEIAAASAFSEDREVLPVLRATDMVKFAGRVPAQSEKREQAARVRAYIHSTMPRPDEENGTENLKGERP